MLIRRALLAVAAISSGVLLFGAPMAQAQDCEKVRGTLVCTSEDDPSPGWETETSKKGSENSSHEEESTVTNPGGNEPPGRQD
jgi:hypothetical protein